MRNPNLFPEPIKTILVENNISCPLCDEELHKGDVLYKDDYRKETFCAYCSDDYEKSIIDEEGLDGRLLK